MEAHKTMRKMMALVLSMVATACGTVQSASVPIDDDDDAEMNPGIDAGMGSGADSGAGSGSGSGSGMTETDVEGPAITLAPSTIKDERGDTIDFSKGEPFHTHVGGTIDLAAAGCPVVYKYPYLMDATIPYGVNVTPNPLAWHVKVTDMQLADGTAAFRVRTDATTVVRDWSAMPAPDGNGVSTIELTRKGGIAPIAALGTRAGQFFVDMRARDWSNNGTVKTVCFDYRPLQAPVAVSAFQDTPMYSISLAADMPTAYVYSGSGTVDVISQTVTQQTAEPTTVTWSATSSAFTYGKATYDGYLSEEKVGGFYCFGEAEPGCATSWNPPAANGYQDVQGTFTPALSVVVVDVASGQTFATSATPSITVTLPARAAGGAARAYRFVVQTQPMSALQPAAINSPLGDFSLFGLKYTGAQSKAAGTHCVLASETEWGPNTWCERVAYHYRFSAIDRATLSMSFTSRLQQSDVDAPYVSASVLMSGTRTWDSGDDDLPGAY